MANDDLHDFIKFLLERLGWDMLAACRAYETARGYKTYERHLVAVQPPTTESEPEVSLD